MAYVNLSEGYWDKESNNHISTFGIKISECLWTALKMKRSNKGFKCKMCNRKLPPKTRKIGQYYSETICYACVPAFVKLAKEDVAKLTQALDDVEKDAIDNKSKYDSKVFEGYFEHPTEET